MSLAQAQNPAINVLGRINSGHQDLVHDVKFDHFGTSLATCSSDHLIKIFQVQKDEGGTPTFTHTADLRGHDDAVWQVSWAFPLHGTLLASCGYDKKVIVWRQEGNQWTIVYEYLNDSPVNCVAFAPFDLGRLMLACGASDGSIVVLVSKDDGTWSATKIPNAHSLGVMALSWGDPFFMPIHGKRGETTTARFVTGGCDNCVKIWRENGENGPWLEENRLDGHTDWVRDVAWRVNRLFEGTTVVSAAQDRRVFIWRHDGHTGWIRDLLNTFDDVPWTLSFSPTGSSLGVFWGTNSMTIFREANGQWTPITETPPEDDSENAADQEGSKQSDNNHAHNYDQQQQQQHYESTQAH